MLTYCYIAEEKRNYTEFYQLLYHFPNSHRTAGCPLNTHQIIAQCNEENHLHIKLKEEFQINPDTFRYHDHSLLHAAVTNGYHPAIPHLLKNGANINDRDKSGQTALHLASGLLNQQAISMLLLCGANVNLTTPITKETALHFAVRSSSCKAGIVLAAGGKCVMLLLLTGGNVYMKDWEGQEVIHSACRNGRRDIINLLLDNDADVNSLTSQGESPLFLFLEKETNLRQGKVLKRLLSSSYPLQLTNCAGHLPKALRHPRYELLKDMLMRMSSDVLSLQDICKFYIRKIYRGNLKCWLRGVIPSSLWYSIYINQEFSYASKINDF
ncbi:ankyrin repeat domain-containing protein 61 [Rhineura floridana]|uniref:ankyrin repeat domain-containing protein 61 n=1 Tax=Rhineura floridana TaxID=261503 RepID=UPI002AC87FA0|nr:ankyrin repeat domain-containing protein 61 [Rhineura floridana]